MVSVPRQLAQAGGNILKDFVKRVTPQRDEAQLRCEAQGGTWDPVNKVCILPTKEPEPAKQADIQKTPVQPSSPEVFRNQQGELSGFTDPRTGQTFLGASPEEVRRATGDILQKTQLPEGTQLVGTAQSQAEEQQRLQQIAGQVGQVGPLTAAEQADINLSQALTAGAARVLPGLAGGAAAGAVVGGVPSAGIGAPLGAAVGAAAGAVTGFTSGVLSNIKEQQRGELQAADVELKNARTNMRQLAMLATQDPANADIYVSQYKDQLTRVHQARRQTQAEVAGDFNAFMEDGREQLADFDSFLQPGGIADIYGQKLSIALSTGTPLSFNGEELLE